MKLANTITPTQMSWFCPASAQASVGRLNASTRAITQTAKPINDTNTINTTNPPMAIFAPFLSESQSVLGHPAERRLPAVADWTLEVVGRSRRFSVGFQVQGRAGRGSATPITFGR